jgi:hypothetical protein
MPIQRVIKNKSVVTLFIFFFACTTVYATQSRAEREELPTSAQQKRSKHVISPNKLNNIVENITIQKNTLKTKLDQLEKTTSEQEKAKIQSKINEITDFIAAQKSSFEMILTAGSALPETDTSDGKEFDWQKDLLEIVQPIISELRQMTEYRRKLDDLQQNITAYKLQIAEIEEVLEHIAQINKQGLGDEALKQFEKINKKWQRELEENKQLLLVARLQYGEMVKSQTAREISISEHFKQFASGRGATLLMALAAFTLVYFSMLMLWKGILWISERKQNEKWAYYRRVITLIYHVMMVMLAIAAVFYVLSVRNDKVLVALSIILLVSVIWVLKSSVPRYINELKILLNTGSVREGECITYNGIQMKVEDLNFDTKLTNPLIPELKIRLPLAELTNYISRPYSKDEPWFPCKTGDYVMLADGKYGLVKCITPENVLLSLYNGMMPQTYAIQDFLAAQPENLSQGFIVTSVIGIDYKYQQQCTNQIPEILREGIKKSLHQARYGGSLKHLRVYFAQANTSSLDFKIVAFFDGQAAEYYYPIERALQRHAVEVCNQQQWEIPFTQVVLHNA